MAEFSSFSVKESAEVAIFCVVLSKTKLKIADICPFCRLKRTINDECQNQRIWQGGVFSYENVDFRLTSVIFQRNSAKTQLFLFCAKKAKIKIPNNYSKNMKQLGVEVLKRK